MLDRKEEQKFKRLRKLAQELHIPVPEAFIELEVTDKDGKVIQKHRQRSHSWVRNAYNFMFCSLAAKNASDGAFGAGLLSVRFTDGTVVGDGYPITWGERDLDSPGWGYLAAAAVTDYGIVVGSGTNAEDFEDYALQTQIAEGTGAGQLNHVQSESHNASYADTTLKDELVRYFNNNSGGDVDVNEVGVIGHFSRISGPYADYEALVCRDKLASTVTVPDTGQLKVTYTIQLTYPA
jgi:hypothetical protein